MVAAPSMATALSLVGLLTTVGAQQLTDYLEAPLITSQNGQQTNPRCGSFGANPGDWRDPTEAECKHYTTLISGGMFVVGNNYPWSPKGVPGVTEIPIGCSATDSKSQPETSLWHFVAPGTGVTRESSAEYHHVCIGKVLQPTTAPTSAPTAAPGQPTAAPTPAPTAAPTCKGVTCLERFWHRCKESEADFGSNQPAAPVKSTKDLLVAECPACAGAANTDTCPTKKLRLYDDAPESEPTSEFDKTSVAVSVPLGLVSALVAMGAVIRVARGRVSNQPVSTQEDEQESLRA